MKLLPLSLCFFFFIGSSSAFPFWDKVVELAHEIKDTALSGAKIVITGAGAAAGVVVAIVVNPMTDAVEALAGVISGDEQLGLKIVRKMFGDGTEWHCGSTNFLEKATDELVHTTCYSLKDPINTCCKAHDHCYTEKRKETNADPKGKAFCDDAFDKCLSGTASGTLCAPLASLFVEVVKRFGNGSYYG